MAEDRDDAPEAERLKFLAELVKKLADVFEFALRLISHPITTVFGALEKREDKERFKEAFYFLAAMLCIWFVLEIPMFLYRGIKLGVLSGLVLFAVEVIAYFLLAVSYSLVLHLLLRIWGVRSDLPHTIPAYFYTSISIPVYAILVYPLDFLKYHVIDKAGTIEILLRPAEYARIQGEVLQVWGRNWAGILNLLQVVVNIWAVVVFVYLSIILARWYRAKYFRCFSATSLVFVLISAFERFVLEPVSAYIEVLFAKS